MWEEKKELGVTTVLLPALLEVGLFATRGD
jgi:hypothetical protein